MKKILVVDDEDFYLKLFTEGLTNVGFEVLTSNDGIDAYRKYLAHQPDMVITDIFMINNGIELLTKIKNDNKEFPVITITGGVGNDDGTNMLELSETLGADYCFQKPIHISDAVGVIKQHFSKIDDSRFLSN